MYATSKQREVQLEKKDLEMKIAHLERELEIVTDSFNKAQQALIQTYLYNLLPDPDWDGTVTVEVGKTVTQMPFKTPEEVWEVLQKIQKNQLKQLSEM